MAKLVKSKQKLYLQCMETEKNYHAYDFQLSFHLSFILIVAPPLFSASRFFLTSYGYLLPAFYQEVFVLLKNKQTNNQKYQTKNKHIHTL